MKKILSKIKAFLKKIEFEPLTRGQKYGLSSSIVVVLVLAIVIFLEVLSFKHSTQFDLTEDRRFTVSEETTNVMKSLKGPIKAVAFVTNNEIKVKVEDLLKQYKYASNGTFTYRFVDLYLKPGEAMAYKVTEDNTIVLIYGDREERAVLSDIDILESGEQTLTDAIAKLLSTEPKTIYLLTKHGERAIDDESVNGFSQIKTGLESQNYVVKTLDLTTTPDVPEDAAGLIVAGPQKDLFAEEITSITEYLNGGGKLLVLLDPGITVPRLTAFLAGIGIVAPNNVIIDRESRLFGADDLIPVASMYLQHPITKDIKFMSFFPYARSVDIDANAAKDSSWTLEVLIKTGPNSWAETNLAALGQGSWELNKGTDLEGPVPVAIVGTKTIEPERSEGENATPKEAKIVVIGNSGFVSNGYYLAAAANFSNIDIFLNSANWLAGSESLISIHPRDKKASPILLTASQGLLIFLVSVIVVPLAVAGAGIFVFFRRRFV